jgi:UDP-3-O-[3-hydroxymyristoyl] glucosamine N-acyltransferase
MRVRDLAEWLGLAFEGDGEVELTGVAPLESAGPGDLSFIGSRKAGRQPTRAGCLIAPPEFVSDARLPLIRAGVPRTVFAHAISRLIPPNRPAPGIHPTAVIGEGSRIGEGCSIGPHVSIGRNVEIGEGSVLHANVTIYDGVTIGKGAILHAGCVIGADGFGFVMEEGRYQKFPQVGTVEIGDFVEIGANACVDRAALGVTSIGEGSKIDNMVHVAHNCRIGRHVVIAAQTGFSGGVVVEDYAVIGGQVGIGDKARIESRAVLGSGCGILTSKIVRSGEVVWGTPARPLKQYLEQLASMARLPAIRKEMAELKRRLAKLETA